MHLLEASKQRLAVSESWRGGRSLHRRSSGPRLFLLRNSTRFVRVHHIAAVRSRSRPTIFDLSRVKFCRPDKLRFWWHEALFTGICYRQVFHLFLTHLLAARKQRMVQRWALARAKTALAAARMVFAGINSSRQGSPLPGLPPRPFTCGVARHRFSATAPRAPFPSGQRTRVRRARGPSAHGLGFAPWR